MKEDLAHDLLVKDLERLLELAKAFEFHDFKNTQYAAPKVQLVKLLTEVAEKTKNGDYDNYN